MSLDQELHVALRIAITAASLVREVYGCDYSVRDKGNDDPVTDADRRSNDYLVAELAAAFPGDSICDEEGQTQAASLAASRGGRCWFVDPLDGTREFIRRSGEFAVMVGLAIDGRPRLGMISAPIWQRTFVGVVGETAYELDAAGARRPLRATQPDAVNGSALRLVLSRLHRNAQVDAAAKALGITHIRECGSTGLKMMLVASGEVDLYMHTGPGPSLWDVCAAEAIVTAASAHVCDALGNPLCFITSELPVRKGVIAAAAPLARRAVEALKASSV